MVYSNVSIRCMEITYRHNILHIDTIFYFEVVKNRSSSLPVVCSRLRYQPASALLRRRIDLASSTVTPIRIADTRCRRLIVRIPIVKLHSNQLLTLLTNNKMKIKFDKKVLDKALDDLYGEIEKIWPEEFKDYFPEAKESMRLAHEHYCQGIPKNGPIKLAVFSESHSRTDKRILGCKVAMTDSLKEVLQREKLDSKWMEIGHVNLVHCPTYGLHQYLDFVNEGDDDFRLSRKANGTPTFWKLLSVLAGEQEDLCAENWDHNFDHLRGRHCLVSKLDILDVMKENGIVFMDVSPMFIHLAAGTINVQNKTTGTYYFTPAEKLPTKIVKQLLRASWDKYAKKFLEYLQPQNLM